jgi:hypothetical protein
VNAEPRWKNITVIIVAVISVALLFFLKPIPQPQDYHHFADTRSFLGIPNVLNVLSNLVFLIVGLLGLRQCFGNHHINNRAAWIITFAGITLVSLGSAFYHWMPDNITLVWDRLPMTIAFMAFLSALLGEYLGSSITRWMLLPALMVGVASVLYWHFTDDLRLYAWVVFDPLLIIIALLLLYRSVLRLPLFFMLLLYIAAKLFETFDAQIYAMLGGTISGHSLKHLLAAVACYCMLAMIKRKQAAAPDGH